MPTRGVLWAAALGVGFLACSASQAQQIKNLLVNGGFETGGVAPWTTGGGVRAEVVTILAGAAVPEGPAEGRYCLHVTVPKAGANFWDVSLQYRGLGFAKGKKYTFSAFFKSKMGPVSVNLKPELSVSPWTGYGERVITMSYTWNEYHVTTPVFDKDASPADVIFHIGFDAAEFWVDDVKVYEGEYVPSAGSSPAAPPTEDDVVIADFEDPTYGPWQVTGVAFGTGPAHGALPNQMEVTGFLGRGLANSFLGGDEATGTLTSPPFTLQRRYVCFLVGGGKSPGQTAVNLLVDGLMVRSATGPNNQPGDPERLDWELWDVAGFFGRPARIQIVDESSAAGGHIIVDQIVHSKNASLAAGREDLVIADFEGQDYGAWQAAGTAFGSKPAHGALPGQMPATGYLGQGLVNSFLGGDTATGTLTSPPFTIERKYLGFLLGGGNDPAHTCITLRAGGRIVRTATGPGGSERLDWKLWDVSDLLGQVTTIQIVDQHADAGGHITVDQIVQTNRESRPTGDRGAPPVALLDDFDDGDLVSKNYCSWSAQAWAANNDGAVLIFENADAGLKSRLPNRAAHARVRAGTGSWAGTQILLRLLGAGSASQRKLYVDYGYDLRGYEAIRFKAKAVPSGWCTFTQVADEAAANRVSYSYTTAIRSEWTEILVPFAQLRSDDTSSPSEESLRHTNELVFATYPPPGTTVDLWLDEVQLMPRSGYTSAVVPEPASGLKEAGTAAGLRVGFMMDPATTSEEPLRKVVARNAHLVLADWGLHMADVSSAPYSYDFVMGDVMVKWAFDHGQKVDAQHLVWHGATPNWLVQGDYSPAEVDAILKEFIQQIIAHYRTAYPDTVTHWSVVNEAIDDNTLSFRKTFWYNKLGEDYIDKAFRYARQADPKLKLYYNDYAIDGLGPKADAVYRLARTLRERGVPIDGVGLQMHQRDMASFPGRQSIADNIDRLGRLGLEVYITEADVVMNHDRTGRTQAKLDRQAAIYREIVEACLASPYCKHVIFFGVTDKYTWLVDSTGHDEWPLLLDEWYQPKPAWYAVRDALTAGRRPLPPQGQPSTEGFESGNFSSFPWQHEGSSSWFVTGDLKHSGSYSARAGAIGDNGISTLKITRACPAGEIRFYVRVASEEACDTLVFSVDGTTMREWSGYTEWIEVKHPVPTGSHTFEWSYAKDDSSSGGQDTAWLDDVVFP